MKNRNQKYRTRKNMKNNYRYSDQDLPEAPRLEIYKETFGGLENITEQWYKENGA